MFWDQFYNGELVEKMGVGNNIMESDFIEDTLVEIIARTLQDPSVSRSCQRHKHKVKGENGALRAAMYLENTLITRGAEAVV